MNEFILSKLALAMWQAHSLSLLRLDAIRVYRLQRIRKKLNYNVPSNLV